MTTTLPIRRIVLGVDPGLAGGLAVLDVGGEVLDLRPMPVLPGQRRTIDARELANWLYATEEQHGAFALAVVERVGAMPRQGIASAFSFGAGWGLVLGVLAALKVPVELATPQRWKSAVLAGTPKDKGAAIAFCRRRWPDTSLVPPRGRVPHDGLADALLIAEYGRRTLAAPQARPAAPRRRAASK